MGRTATQPNSVLGQFEAELVHTFLPGCTQCGGSHPLARKGNLDPAMCPDCGAPAGAPGKAKLVPAITNVRGVSGFFARLFLQAGAALRAFAERLQR